MTKYGSPIKVGRRNLVQFPGQRRRTTTARWKLKQAFEGYWLATHMTTSNGSSGAIAVPAHPGASPHIGKRA